MLHKLLYGDTFKKLKKNGSWIKIKNDSDNYKGFIKKKLFSTNQKNTHKVCNLSAKLYSRTKYYKIKKNLVLDLKLKFCKKKIIFINLIICGLKKKI